MSAAMFSEVRVAADTIELRLSRDLAPAERAAVPLLMEAVMRVLGTLDAQRQEAAIGRLADVLLPDNLAEARGVLAADNLALRDRFVAETAPLTGAQVGAMAGHSARNPYATAARWKKSGEVFSVSHRGIDYFPAFQFRDGRPHPGIRQIVAALPRSMSSWQTALWFVAANGWLDGRPPADCLDDTDAVLQAARLEGEELAG